MQLSFYKGTRRLIATYRQAVLIYNPVAGRLRRDSGCIARVLDELSRGGHCVKAEPTTGPRTAAMIARRAIDAGADLILSCGGDGTVNEVVNGMVGSAVALGVLPAGTANVLAMDLGLGSRIARVAAQVGQLEPARVAVGLLRAAGEQPRHFLLMAGAGVDAHIVYGIDPVWKGRLGKLAYWVGGAGLPFRRLPEFAVRVDGREIRSSFALASRVRNYGGDLSIARRVTLRDDDFELVLFAGASGLRYAKYFTGVLTGTAARMKGVSVLRARRVEFSDPTQPDVHIQIDGESAGRMPASVEIVPGALTLLVPRGYGTTPGC